MTSPRCIAIGRGAVATRDLEIAVNVELVPGEYTTLRAVMTEAEWSVVRAVVRRLAQDHDADQLARDIETHERDQHKPTAHVFVGHQAGNVPRQQRLLNMIGDGSALGSWVAGRAVEDTPKD